MPSDSSLSNLFQVYRYINTLYSKPFGAWAALFLSNGELLGHSPMLKCPTYLYKSLSVI